MRPFGKLRTGCPAVHPGLRSEALGGTLGRLNYTVAHGDVDRMGSPDRRRRLGFSHQFESEELLQDRKAFRAGRQYICVHSDSVSCWGSCSASFTVPSPLDLPHQLSGRFLRSPIQTPWLSASPLRPPCLPYNSVQLEESVGLGASGPNSWT